MGACWCDVCNRHEDECDCMLVSAKSRHAIAIHLLEARRLAKAGDQEALSVTLATIELLLDLRGSASEEKP
jgi:hypothetical protein